MIASNPTVFGPGPGQLVWFFAAWSAVHMWFAFVYPGLRGRKK